MNFGLLVDDRRRQSPRSMRCAAASACPCEVIVEQRRRRHQCRRGRERRSSASEAVWRVDHAPGEVLHRPAPCERSSASLLASISYMLDSEAFSTKFVTPESTSRFRSRGVVVAAVSAGAASAGGVLGRTGSEAATPAQTPQAASEVLLGSRSSPACSMPVATPERRRSRCHNVRGIGGFRWNLTG